MQAIELTYESCEGMISIPKQYKDWFRKSFKVILLVDKESTPPTSSQDSINEEVKSFFENIQFDLSQYRFNRDEANERQVVNECTNVYRITFQLNYRRIAEIINNYLKKVTLVSITMLFINQAWKIADKYGYAYYESLIIASALENDCTILYSEDWHHEQIIEERLSIMNPFVL